MPPGTLQDLLKQVEGRPSAMARLARQLLAMNRGAEARELSARAIALDPDDSEVRVLAAGIMSFGVPTWHFTIVDDEDRNRAYDRALQRVVKPGTRVLEIGTGTGLLAMMAARAGAKEVITCEANPAVAATATEIISRNGFSDRVRVVAKHSTDLEIGVDMTEPADLLVSEIVSNNLIGEGVLPATENAARRLLKPGAPIIPARGAIRVALAEDSTAHRRRMGVVAGFDLSPFNRLGCPHYQIPVDRKGLTLRSSPLDLFQFDFQSGEGFPSARKKLTLSSGGGRVNGIVQWIRFDLDDQGSYENCPSVVANSSWAALFYPLASARDTAPGDPIAVCGEHDRVSLRIWTENST